jgi:hypothetical protein
VYPAFVDLGPRRYGELVAQEFEIENKSSKNVMLRSFSTSCSCAGVENEIDSKAERVESLTIPPRGRASLRLRISVAAKIGGGQMVNVFFRADDEPEKQRAIQFRIGQITGGLYCEPALVHFGSCSLGEMLTKEVDIYDNGAAELTIRDVVSTRPERFQVRRLGLRAGERTRVHATAGRLIERVEVQVVASAPGSLDGEVEVVVTNRASQRIWIPVSGRVVDQGKLAPDQKSFGGVGSGVGRDSACFKLRPLYPIWGVIHHEFVPR